MNRSLVWRGVLILGLVLLFAFAAYPPWETVKLGLDLRGGIHLVLEVETNDALVAETDKDIERLLQELEDENIQGIGALQDEADANRFTLSGLDQENDRELRQIVDDFLPGWGWSRSGTEVSFRRRADAANQIEQLAVVQAEQTIRNRIDAFGVAEPFPTVPRGPLLSLSVCGEGPARQGRG